jgi:hypothetical protein
VDARTAQTTNPRKAVQAYLTSPDVGTAFLQLAIVGLIAIGISGALAAGMAAALGRRFVSGDPPGIRYSSARCADYFEYQPRARDCEQAATLHHYGEIVGYRTDAGILGLILLTGYLLYRRRSTSHVAAPADFTAAIAIAAFGAAGVGFLGQSFVLLARGERTGVGAYLSAGIVSSVAAIGCAVWLFLARRSAGKPVRRKRAGGLATEQSRRVLPNQVANPGRSAADDQHL